MIKLHDIESAILPQFAWDHSSIKRLQTTEFKRQSLAITVFIGICDSFKFPMNQVTEYLCIEVQEYENKLNKFRNNWQLMQVRKQVGTLFLSRHTIGDYDYPERLFLKTKLVINALRYKGHDVSCSQLSTE